MRTYSRTIDIVVHVLIPVLPVVVGVKAGPIWSTRTKLEFRFRFRDQIVRVVSVSVYRLL